MRAVRIAGPGEVSLVELPDPEPQPGEVLVRVDRASLCPTDFKLTRRGMDPPTVPGHEAIGRLDDGTLVGVHPDVGCCDCHHCRIGVETRCPRKRAVGVHRDGGLAELVTVRRDHAVPLRDLDPARAPILEPVACCLHAVALLQPEPGRPALVVGAGAMGVLNMWVLQAAGCVVAVSEPEDARREQAADLGADAVLTPDQHPADALGEWPRTAIVTAPSATALEATLGQVDIGGSVHAFAGIPDGGELDVNVVHYRHLRLVGSSGSDPADYERARDLVRVGRVPLDRLPVEVVGLDDVPARLGDADRGDGLKTIVDIAGGTR
jgi:NADPH2:quinone reductase